MGFNRRDFLRLSAVGLAGAAISSNALSQYTGFNLPRIRNVDVGLNLDVNICEFGGYEGPCASGPLPAQVAADAGLTSVRYAVYWSIVNPQKGQYKWWFPDFEVASAVDAGLDVYLNIGGAPRWATGGLPTNEPFYCSEGFLNDDGSMGVRYARTKPGCDNPAPLDAAAVQEMVFTTVKRYSDPRYKGKVKWVSAVNEPNYNFFWQWGTWEGDNFTPDFDKLRQWVLKPAYDAAKAANPDILVVGPEIDDVGSLDRFMRMEQEHGKLMDVISFHGYDWGLGYPDGALSRTKQFLDIALNYKENRPVWVTETGTWSHPKRSREMREQAERTFWYLRGVEEMGGIDNVMFYRMRGGDTKEGAWMFKDNITEENKGKELPLLVKPVTHAMREYLTGKPFPSPYPSSNGTLSRRRAVRQPSFDVRDTLYDPKRKLYVKYDDVKHEYIPA